MECGSVNDGAEPTIGAAVVSPDSCTNQQSFENDLFSSEHEKCYSAVM